MGGRKDGLMPREGEQRLHSKVRSLSATKAWGGREEEREAEGERLGERRGGGTSAFHVETASSAPMKPAKRLSAAPRFQRWGWKGVGDALQPLITRNVTLKVINL